MAEGSNAGGRSLLLAVVLLGALLVVANLAAVFLVIENGNSLAKGRTEIEAFANQKTARDNLVAEQYRRIDEQSIAMERLRNEQRDLDQRKRDRDAAIAERDEVVRAQRGAETARDKALADARTANADSTSVREGLVASQAEAARLGVTRSNLQVELERLQRDRLATEAALLKAADERTAAEAQAQAALQARDEARRTATMAQRDRDGAVEAATRAKTDQISLESRVMEASGAVQRGEERRRQATAQAEAEELRGRKAAEALSTAQAAQQAFITAAPQREAELAKRLQTAQAATVLAETGRVARQQELDAVQALLTAARSDQTRLQSIQATVQSAQQALAATQQQQAQRQAQLGLAQRALEEQRDGVAKAQAEQGKVQAERDAMQADLKTLTAARDQMRQDLGQRDQIGRDLEAMNRSVGERRVEVTRLRDETDQARAERMRVVAEQSALERQRADLVAVVPSLTTQRDVLLRERDAAAGQAETAGLALSRAARERDAVEQEIVRLRGFAATLVRSGAVEPTVESAVQAGDTK